MILGDVVIQVIFAREQFVAELTLDLIGRMHQHVTRHHPARGERLLTRRARETLGTRRERAAALVAYVKRRLAEKLLRLFDVTERHGHVSEQRVGDGIAVRKDGLIQTDAARVRMQRACVRMYRVPIKIFYLQHTNTRIGIESNFTTIFRKRAYNVTCQTTSHVSIGEYQFCKHNSLRS